MASYPRVHRGGDDRPCHASDGERELDEWPDLDALTVADLPTSAMCIPAVPGVADRLATQHMLAAPHGCARALASLTKPCKFSAMKSGGPPPSKRSEVGRA
jgi:hypothetical protein